MDKLYELNYEPNLLEALRERYPVLLKPIESETSKVMLNAGAVDLQDGNVFTKNRLELLVE